MKYDNADLQKQIFKMKAEITNKIGKNDNLFIQRIFSDGVEKYKNRIEALGFSGKQKVLDAGCGYGQWSLALADLNNVVESCDISSTRVKFLKEIAARLDISNINSQVSRLDSMPYPDSHFDAVFCYGVIFLTPWRNSLRELIRVLKPGGQLYVNANGLGWYMFLWQEEHNKTDNYDPKAISAKALSDTLRYDRDAIYEPGMHLLIEPKSIITEMRRLGLQDITNGPEGTLHLNKTVAAPESFFLGEYFGQVGVFEVCGTKK